MKDNFLDQSCDSVFKKSQYCELAVFLSTLKGLYNLHQHAHWLSQGNNFYEDHLMFQRMYEGILPEIDGIAEKILGLGDNADSLLNPIKILKVEFDFIQGLGITINTNVGVNELLKAETEFLSMSDNIISSLTSKELITSGLKNFLEGILDNHETNVYLLKRRFKKTVA